MFDWKAITPLLEAKLDPKNVKPPAPGRHGEYIEGWWAISEANRIFGHGEWSYSVDSLTLLDREKIKVRDKWGKEIEQWRCAYEALVTVSVGDVKRQDVGYGQGQAKVPNIGDAMESAGKEAVTDALKRTLRTFGYPLGLALYDKSKSHVGVDHPDPAPSAEPPHDPETGEILGDEEGGPNLQAWIGGIRDKLPAGATRYQIAQAYAASVIEKIGTYKKAKWLDLFLSVHEPAISKLPDDLMGDVQNAIGKQRAQINGEAYDPRDFAPAGVPGMYDDPSPEEFLRG